MNKTKINQNQLEKHAIIAGRIYSLKEEYEKRLELIRRVRREEIETGDSGDLLLGKTIMLKEVIEKLEELLK